MKEGRILRYINGYKRKYYLNLLLHGGLFFSAVIFTVYILITSLEFLTQMNSWGRGVLFFGFLGLMLYVGHRFLYKPLAFFLGLHKGISVEEAASHIGSHFPTIKDRLLNYLQITKLDRSSDLVEASLRQRAKNFDGVTFAAAIDLNENRSKLKYLAPSLVVGLVILILVPQLFTTSTKRIMQFHQEFTPMAPFSFDVNETSLLAFKNEDHQISLNLAGDGIPENTYLVHRDRRIKMASLGHGSFSYTFSKIQVPKRIHFEAAGYKSGSYLIQVVNLPNLKSFNVELTYPSYLRRPTERLENTGNLNLPEGTTVTWMLNITHTKELRVLINDEVEHEEEIQNEIFEYERTFEEEASYEFRLSNEYASNRESIKYQAAVIEDQFPGINVNVYEDTVMYSYLVLAGAITDDYGITNLKMHYSFIDEHNQIRESKYVPLTFNRQQVNQSFFHQWNLDSFNIESGQKIEYYVQVWDNDGVNGIKSSKSSTYIFEIPSEEEIKNEIAQSSEKTSDDMQNTVEEAEALKKELEELEGRLRGKKDLDWQDEQKLQELIDRKEELNKTIEELQKQFEADRARRERFREQSEQINKSVEDIQSLMDELLDEETRKLYEELKKLLEKEYDSDRIQEMLDRINRKEDNLVKELERALELFKRMKLNYMLEESIQELNELSDKQTELAEESLENDSNTEEIVDQQEELINRFEDFQKSLEEIEEMNQELEHPRPMQDFSQNEQSIQGQMEKARDLLQENQSDTNSEGTEDQEQQDIGEQGDQDEQNDPSQESQQLGDKQRPPQSQKSKASKMQRGAGREMKQMSQQLQQMQSGMEMQMMISNLNDLREILHNLIKLSFDQEELMKEFRGVDQSDPRFVELGQWQLKIKDDAKIVEDSLMSLARRAFQMGAFVTREVAEMNGHLDNSIEAIRDRKKSKAASEQQFAMTSMNNLALMLDDVMDGMMNALSDAMGGNPKPGQSQLPSLSELQQHLNQRIEELKKSGKSGRDLSEELAKLAAEQERIRKALQEMESQLEEGSGESRNEIAEKMEETEMDLVNKQITAETIKRQRQILTRLLEAENAMRERELENEREGETARKYDRVLPEAFEEYFKAKEKEVELLKTVPPKLYPYYKKEVNEYFKRIGNQNFE